MTRKTIFDLYNEQHKNETPKEIKQPNNVETYTPPTIETPKEIELPKENKFFNFEAIKETEKPITTETSKEIETPIKTPSEDVGTSSLVV